jgi:hypothetical protein
MFKKERVTALRVLTLLIGIIALIASLAGIVRPGIYAYLVDAAAMPFQVGQDAVTAAAAIVLLIASVFGIGKKPKWDILQIGMSWETCTIIFILPTSAYSDLPFSI